MAFSDLGSLGATGSTANNQTTLALTTAAQASAGELVVIVIADDNINTADGDGMEVASISDNASGGSNSWGRAIGHALTTGVAQAGAAVQIWYSILDRTIANGGTITVTFTNATLSDATALTARHFSFSGTQVCIENVNSGTTTAGDPGALDVVTSNIECLRIRGIAGEVGNNTSLTVTTNWTGWANGNSATSGTTAEMCARAEHHISTGTGDSSDPTWVSCDNASGYVAFREVPTGTACFVNSGIYLTNASATSIAPARPPVRKNGNLLLAFAWIGGNTTASVSGTGWTLVETTNNGTITLAWAWCIVNGSEQDPTFSWAGASNNGAIILQYCNTDQAAPIGAHNNGLGSGTTITVSAVTTTRNTSLVAAILEDGTANNIPALPTNYSRKYFQTVVAGTSNSMRACEEQIATSGSSSDGVSVAIASANWRGVIVEIKTPLPVKFRRTLSQLGTRTGSRQRIIG